MPASACGRRAILPSHASALLSLLGTFAAVAAVPTPKAARRSASWWRDIGDVSAHPSGQGLWSASQLTRLCLVPDTTPPHWSAAACASLAAIPDASETRLLLDAEPSADKSWLDLLELRPEKTASGAVLRAEHLKIPVPLFSDAPQQPRRVSVLCERSTRPCTLWPRIRDARVPGSGAGGAAAWRWCARVGPHRGVASGCLTRPDRGDLVAERLSDATVCARSNNQSLLTRASFWVERPLSLLSHTPLTRVRRLPRE